MSDNKYVLPAKDFVSSDVAGHITCIFTRFRIHSQESPMVSEQMCITNHFILHLWNTRSSISERVKKTSVELCIVNFEFDLNIPLYLITSLKKFCHMPIDKKQNKTKTKKTEIDKLINKAVISMSTISRRLSIEEKKMYFWFSLNFTFRRKFMSA